MLCGVLQSPSFHTHQAASDDDTLIASMTLKVAENENVTVAADDTDILGSSCYHWSECLNIINSSQNNWMDQKEKERKVRYWNVTKSARALQSKRYLLFEYAWAGSDRTSIIYQQG